MSTWQPGRPVILETPRLRIRTLTEDDALAMRGWLAEPAIRANLWLPDIDVDAYFVQMARFADQRTRFAFTLLHTRTDQTVGFAKLVVDSERRTQIPTLALGRPEFRDRQLGSEATMALLRFGFEHLAVDRVECRLYEENARLRARLAQGGCRETKVYAERVPGRAPRNVHVFVLDRTEWLSLAGELERSPTPQ